MAANDVTEPAIQALIAAINAGDRAAFFAALTPAQGKISRFETGQASQGRGSPDPP